MSGHPTSHGIVFCGGNPSRRWIGRGCVSFTHPRIAGKNQWKSSYEPIRKAIERDSVDDAPIRLQKEFSGYEAVAVSWPSALICLQLPQTRRDVYRLQRFLGHRSIDVTIDLYGQLQAGDELNFVLVLLDSISL